MVRMKALLTGVVAVATLSMRAPTHLKFEVSAAHADDGGDGGGGDGDGDGNGDGDGDGDDGEGDDGQGDPAEESEGLAMSMDEVALGVIALDPIDVTATPIGAPSPESDAVGRGVESAAAANGVPPGAAQALGIVGKNAAQNSIAQGKSMSQVARDVAVEVAAFARDIGLALSPEAIEAIAGAIVAATDQFGGA